MDTGIFSERQSSRINGQSENRQRELDDRYLSANEDVQVLKSKAPTLHECGSKQTANPSRNSSTEHNRTRMNQLSECCVKTHCRDFSLFGENRRSRGVVKRRREILISIKLKYSAFRCGSAIASNRELQVACAWIELETGSNSLNTVESCWLDDWVSTWTRYCSHEHLAKCIWYCSVPFGAIQCFQCCSFGTIDWVLLNGYCLFGTIHLVPFSQYHSRYCSVPLSR